jgi:hypothetical protein
MADARTYEVASTLATQNLLHLNEVWQEIFEKYTIFIKALFVECKVTV